MSDDFIPLNQSTPIQNRWQQDRSMQRSYHNNRQHNMPRRGGHKHNNNWGNSSRSSYGSNSSNNSYGQENNGIDAYLHPTMLQDPWASLRQKNEMNKSN